MEGEEGDTSKKIEAKTFGSVIGQILILDLVFSIDSIITAVGMVNELWIMYTAVIVTVGIMLLASGPISNFVNKHPAFKMLALSFLLLIGSLINSRRFRISYTQRIHLFLHEFCLACRCFSNEDEQEKKTSGTDTRTLPAR